MNNPYQVMVALNRETSFIVLAISLFYLSMFATTSPPSLFSRCKDTKYVLILQVLKTQIKKFNFYLPKYNPEAGGVVSERLLIFVIVIIIIKPPITNTNTIV